MLPIKTFNTQEELNAYIESIITKKFYPYFYLCKDTNIITCSAKGFKYKPLTFENISNTAISLGFSIHYNNIYETEHPNLQISYDNITWRDVTEEEWYAYNSSGNYIFNLEPDSTIYFKGDNPDGFNHGIDEICDYVRFVFSSNSGSIKVSGNIMSLINSTKYTDFQDKHAYSFFRLFSASENDTIKNTAIVDAKDLILANNTAESCYMCMFDSQYNLTEAPELPATILAENCYKNIFKYCASLTSTPELPATTLAPYCYASMFEGCTSLIAAPELPATTLTEYCYAGMFGMCTSLTSAPELPATTLTEYCYYEMFNGCTSLIAAPELPATTLTEYCYALMLAGCTSLTSAPELPATTLAESCYTSMFGGCMSLTSAPTLPATTLANNCYISMFGDCTSLTSAPELPATTLTDYCYGYMFAGCTSLTSAPTLLATTLAEFCYMGMFNSCTSLNYIKCLATDIDADNSTLSWLSDVSSEGTFVKAASMTSWPVGPNGIPENWTVEDA